MKHHKRHLILYRILRALIRPFFYLKFNYTCEKVEPKQKPFLLVCNHTTFLDPAFVGLSFKDFTYCVASAHIRKQGFASKLLDFVFAPIYIVKTSSDLTTVKNIVKAVKSGCNVCLFAEGNRTYNGLTQSIPQATGKLVKLCKCSLITYRLDGGYFTHPRWAKYTRRGKMYGHAVKEYSAEDIAKLSAEEINDILAADLYENAYAKQQNEMIAYKGKALAENLEGALYFCPECKSIGHMRSSGDRFFCECGMAVTIDEYGYFHAANDYGGSFEKEVASWDVMQKRQLSMLLSDYENTDENEVITSDKNQYFSSFSSDEERCGEFKCYKNRFTFEAGGKETNCFYFSDIAHIEAVGRMNMIFTTTDGVYFVRTETPRSPFKYIDIYNINKDKHNKDERKD